MVNFIQHQNQHPPYRISSSESPFLSSKSSFIPCLESRKLYGLNYPHTLSELVPSFIFIGQSAYLPLCFRTSAVPTCITKVLLIVVVIVVGGGGGGGPFGIFTFIYPMMESKINFSNLLLYLSYLNPHGLSLLTKFLNWAFKNLVSVTFCSYSYCYPVLT